VKQWGDVPETARMKILVYALELHKPHNSRIEVHERITKNTLYRIFA